MSIPLHLLEAERFPIDVYAYVKPAAPPIVVVWAITLLTPPDPQSRYPLHIPPLARWFQAPIGITIIFADGTVSVHPPE